MLYVISLAAKSKQKQRRALSTLELELDWCSIAAAAAVGETGNLPRFILILILMVALSTLILSLSNLRSPFSTWLHSSVATSPLKHSPRALGNMDTNSKSETETQHLPHTPTPTPTHTHGVCSRAGTTVIKMAS